MIGILNVALSLCQQNNKAMPYKRKIRQAKSTSNLAEMNIDVVLDSISKGAILDIKEGWWKTEYIVKYPEGGYYRISKRIYDKLSKA